MHRVLVVDDEHLIADTLTTILRRSGYEVRTAYSAEDAISLAGQFKPHAVISDVVMPGISGVQMAMRLLDEHPQCRVLLFSGQTITTDLLTEARARGYEFPLLRKPVHPRVLMHLLHKALADTPADSFRSVVDFLNS